MDLKTAFNVVAQAINAGFKNGTYSLQDAGNISVAINVLNDYLQENLQREAFDEGFVKEEDGKDK